MRAQVSGRSSIQVSLGNVGGAHVVVARIGDEIAFIEKLGLDQFPKVNEAQGECEQEDAQPNRDAQALSPFRCFGFGHDAKDSAFERASPLEPVGNSWNSISGRIDIELLGFASVHEVGDTGF